MNENSEHISFRILKSQYAKYIPKILDLQEGRAVKVDALPTRKDRERFVIFVKTHFPVGYTVYRNNKKGACYVVLEGDNLSHLKGTQGPAGRKIKRKSKTYTCERCERPFKAKAKAKHCKRKVCVRNAARIKRTNQAVYISCTVCTETVQRKARRQVTCGKQECRDEHMKRYWRRRNERRKQAATQN